MLGILNPSNIVKANPKNTSVARAKKVRIGKRVYTNVNSVCKSLAISASTVRHRIGSDDYPTWNYE